MSMFIRLVKEEELDVADLVLRLAFGTQDGLEDPLQSFGDRDMLKARWKGRTSTVLVAEEEGAIVGTTVITKWGSIGFFGRMAVKPDCWGRGIASQLTEAAVKLFDEWHVSVAGLDTFPDSSKHIQLYQKFDFWPRFLTAILVKQVKTQDGSVDFSTFSNLSVEQRERFLEQTIDLTNSIYRGLDVSAEIESVHSQSLGDTVLITDRNELACFAVCHCGKNTEAGSDRCYIKFGGINPSHSPNSFQKLLGACEAYARKQGVGRLMAGINTGRKDAYRVMLRYGFRVSLLKVTMHRPNQPAYDAPEVFVMDRWS